jgi:large subunit ribosomal protein L9
MNVILTENVKGLGNMGDVVKVKPGYARNFLVPNKLAVEASTRNLNELEHHRRQLTRKAEKLSQEASVLKNRIETLECVLAHRAGEEGKLFGSVTSMEIEAALAAKGIEIDRRKILLDQPIKSLGSHEVAIKLNAGVNATLKVCVVAADEPAKA